MFVTLISHVSDFFSIDLTNILCEIVGISSPSLYHLIDCKNCLRNCCGQATDIFSKVFIDVSRKTKYVKQILCCIEGRFDADIKFPFNTVLRFKKTSVQWMKFLNKKRKNEKNSSKNPC